MPTYNSKSTLIQSLSAILKNRVKTQAIDSVKEDKVDNETRGERRKNSCPKCVG